MRKPLCTIVAGSNGAGKSSIYDAMDLPGTFVNADIIATSLKAEGSPSDNQIKAGRFAIKQINSLIELQSDFVFETTLSSNHSLNVVRRAKDAGFHIGIIYVALDKVERNVERVRYRVALGGHDIPTEAIARRYESSFRSLEKVLALVDSLVVIDNSAELPRLIFQGTPTFGQWHYATSSALHMRLKAIVDQFFLQP